MQSFLVILLCSSLLLEGCYSFYPLTTTQREVLLGESNLTIQITLIDGTEIVAEPYHYIQVSEPSDFLIGVGELWNVRTNSKSAFQGKIQSQGVDSGWTTGYRPALQRWERVPVRYWEFWVSDSTKVRFKKDDFIAVTKEQGTGLYVNGYTESGSGMYERRETYQGKISFDQIQKIERRRISEVKTILLEAVIVASIAASIYLYRILRALEGFR
jgi:NDP-sugar pyrophosphorylase family protein